MNRPGVPAAVVDSGSGINFRALEHVVSKQLNDDAKYDRENDAKFRAVAQRVATYEEFENIVIGAHLKPMKDDITDLEFKRSTWDSSGRQAGRYREKMLQDAAARGASAAVMATEMVVPKSVQAFLRFWRKGNLNVRCEYLHMISGPGLAELFKREIPDGNAIVVHLSVVSVADNNTDLGLLGEFLVALNSDFREELACSVVSVLEALSNTYRFELCLEFLSNAESAAGRELLKKCQDVGLVEDEAEKLARVSNTFSGF